MSKKIEWTVEMADKQIEKWKKIKGVIIRANQLSENDDCAVLIYKLYLQNTSVAKVAEILNEQGYRTPSATGTRKISSNDISEVIRSAEIDDKDYRNWFDLSIQMRLILLIKFITNYLSQKSD